ncbi:MAG: hypothetical protein JST19_10130 [Bacteroidetes bacterium]|nr:hypothetical protein [Bacteroidota bacterium]
MLHCRNGVATPVRHFFLIFLLFLILGGFPGHVFAQTDSSGRRERPQPPPRPRHPSLKEMVDKINIFKKHKKDDESADAGKQNTADDNSKQPDPKPTPPAPTPPQPKSVPAPVKPKTAVKHTVKKKTTKPTTDQKKPKTASRPTQPII